MTEQLDTPQLPATTAPSNFAIKIPDDLPKSLAETIGLGIAQLGKCFDLSSLDGVTIAYDYQTALSQLDRGYPTQHVLTATTDTVTGIGGAAMSARVIRSGQLKSHLVFDALYISPITDFTHSEYSNSLYLLAHECAHVEITSRYETAFPGQLLKDKGQIERIYSNVIHGAWDEYAACRMSYGIGSDQTEFYENNLFKQLNEAPQRTCNDISSYRQSLNGYQLLIDVYRTQGNLLKYASYYLGNLAESGDSWEERMATKQALIGSWFIPFLKQLDVCLTNIWSEYGIWGDHSSFEEIGALADEMVAQAGVDWFPMIDGSIDVRLVS